MSTRLDAIAERAADHNADGVILSSLRDIRWATGFTGSNALLVVLPGGAHLLTDGRYREQAAQEVSDAEIHIVPDLNEAAASVLKNRASTLVCQSDVLTLDDARQLREGIEAKWVEVPQFIDALIAQKTEEEIAAIARAQHLTDQVFDEIRWFVRPGMSEQEVAAEIVYLHLRRGAQRMSFDPIVASGANSALPHARPTEKLLMGGDLVVLDFGCVVDGYASDMTRTVAIGEASEEARAVYDVVLRAQQAALDSARAGITTKALDSAARALITESGYGDAFSHGLGHGIGLRTHEWPRLSQHTDDVLPLHCAVTIEPGIYLPGRFGVRIEDIVVLEQESCRNLTQTPKDLLVL